MSTSAAWSQRWWLPWHLYSDDPRRAGRLTDPFWSSPGSMDPPGRLPWLTALPLETRKCLAVGRLCWVRHASLEPFPRRMDSHAGGCPALGTGGCTHLPVRARVADGGARPGTPWWYGADLPGRGTASASPPLSPLRQRTPHIGGCPRPLFRRGTRRRTNRTLPAVAAAKVCARAARTHTQYVHATATGGVGALLSFFLSSSSPPLGFFFSFVCAVGRGLPASAAGGRPAVS